MERAPTLGRVLAAFEYDSETGVMRWRESGKVAGTVDPDGYRAVQLDGVIYRLHRVVWLYVQGVWPTGVIDHRDGDPSNNRIGNLRDVTQAVNVHNQSKPSSHNRSSRSIGVSWQPTRKRWLATIQVDGRSIFIGRYRTEDEAARAYWCMKAEVHPTAPVAAKV